ncbi:MAG: restriction endonuclease subunit S [Deferrisomatales bacterium]
MSEWRSVELQDIATVERGKFSARPRNDPRFYGGEYPFVQTGDISSAKGRLRAHSQTLNDEGLKVSKLFGSGSILMTIAANIGDVALTTYPVACPDSLIGIRPKKGINAYWLLHALMMKKTDLESAATQNAQKNINLQVVRPLVIEMPPGNIQNRIAGILEDWTRAIDLTDQLVAEKKERRKGLMQQLLTGKRRLPGFDGKWREHEIGKLFREVNRPVTWNDEERYQLISVRRRSGGLFHRDSLYGHQILTKNLKTVHTGDFLISKMQVLHGATGLVTPEFAGMKVSGSYITLVSREPTKVSTEFFCYFSQLPSFYHLTFLASYGVHIEKMTFNVKWFMRSKVNIPPTLEEQGAIVDALRLADKEIDLLQSKADALREQKKGLMQQLLAGKKRVKVTVHTGAQS